MKKLAMKHAVNAVVDMNATTFSKDPGEVYAYLEKQAKIDGGYDRKIVLHSHTPTLRAVGLFNMIERTERNFMDSFSDLLKDAEEAMVELAVNDKFPNDLNQLSLKSLLMDVVEK
ncbi:hypothetical protein [Vibrio owensii]|uniref:hypothetical protein n=1 Tax=Vibrio owensii TaxID=696485 RepID=UPI0018F1520E|nr:hypothetical protein [Vibrio owensii]